MTMRGVNLALVVILLTHSCVGQPKDKDKNPWPDCKITYELPTEAEIKAKGRMDIEAKGNGHCHFDQVNELSFKKGITFTHLWVHDPNWITLEGVRLTPEFFNQ